MKREKTYESFRRKRQIKQIKETTKSCRELAAQLERLRDAVQQLRTQNDTAE